MIRCACTATSKRTSMASFAGMYVGDAEVSRDDSRKRLLAPFGRWQLNDQARLGRVVMASLCSSGSHATTNSSLTATTGVLLAWDGRLDNTRDLASELGNAESASDHPFCDDAQYVCAAYLKWADRCVERLVGDFAFALWDSREQRLLLARDRFGVRPLYIAHEDGVYLWSSEIDYILSARVTKSNHLNLDYIAGFLTYTDCADETPYRGIYAIKPGTLSVVTPE